MIPSSALTKTWAVSCMNGENDSWWFSPSAAMCMSANSISQHAGSERIGPMSREREWDKCFLFFLRLFQDLYTSFPKSIHYYNHRILVGKEVAHIILITVSTFMCSVSCHQPPSLRCFINVMWHVVFGKESVQKQEGGKKVLLCCPKLKPSGEHSTLPYRQCCK